MPIAYGTLAPAMVRNRASTFYSDRWDSLVESLASIRSGIGIVLLLVAALYLVHKSRLRPMSAGGVNFASQSRLSKTNAVVTFTTLGFKLIPDRMVL